ncbi:MAG: hypothetical protein ACI9F9_002316 [Candidatus Paceibacteria bacterium]|jgi:hypothetical protein
MKNLLILLALVFAGCKSTDDSVASLSIPAQDPSATFQEPDRSF